MKRLSMLLSLLLALLTMFTLGSNVARALVYTSTDVPKDIDSEATVSSIIAVPASSELIADVNVSLNITHTFVGDLIIQLQSPAGTIVTLLSRPNNGGGGCTGDNMNLTLDDESASGNVNQVCTSGIIGEMAYTAGALLRPANPLNAFDGEVATGTWTLSISDNYFGDEGTLNGWSLDITTGQPPSDVALDNTSIAENSAVGTLIGTLSTSDPDSASFTYMLVSGAGDTGNSQFTISGDQLLSNAVFDYETQNTYSVRIRTTDSTGFSYEEAFTITVTDAAEIVPAITSPATAAGVVGTAFSHTFTATGDPAPTLTYANENLPPGVTRTGDTLSGTPTAAGTYTIDVTASNGVSPDAFQTFTLTVTDTFVPPPPVPTCNEVGNESSAVVRAQAADGTITNGAAFCRVLVENGSFKGDPGQVGNLTLIQWGIAQAVEVFGLTAGGHPIVPFSHPVYVCLRGTGTLYYADASNAPRTYSEIASVEQDGFTCASIPNAGTLVLVNGGA